VCTEIEEIRCQIEENVKWRKQAEHDLHEMVDKNGDMNMEYQFLLSEKRKLEKDVADLRIDLDDMFVELKNAEDNGKRIADDNCRLVEELRKEQVFILRL
jgi:hypothetical protein